jgi:hypothetical protein
VSTADTDHLIARFEDEIRRRHQDGESDQPSADLP